MKELKIYNTLFVQVVSDECHYICDAAVYANEIIEKIKNEDIDLAVYADDYHGDSYYKKLRKITMGIELVGNEYYGLATCQVDDDWTDEDTDQLKEYLSGQYSDGWGEGFEDESLCRFTEMEQDYDEENDEYYTYELEYDVYVCFWQNMNFKIMTEEELKDSQQ